MNNTKLPMIIPLITLVWNTHFWVQKATVNKRTTDSVPFPSYVHGTSIQKCEFYIYTANEILTIIIFIEIS